MTVQRDAGPDRATRETETTRQERAPEALTRMPKGSWGGVLKRTVREFKEDNLTDLAAALTYYGILAIFPAMIALISVVGLSATRPRRR